GSDSTDSRRGLQNDFPQVTLQTLCQVNIGFVSCFSKTVCKNSPIRRFGPIWPKQAGGVRFLCQTGRFPWEEKSDGMTPGATASRRVKTLRSSLTSGGSAALRKQRRVLISKGSG